MEFLGKKTDWDSRLENFLLHGNWKGYEKLLVSSGSMPGMDMISTQDKYEDAMEGDTDLNKNIVKLGDLNELA